MEKRLLLGDEAIALGALHAGLSGVYAYPGTPSTEITEFIQNATGYGKETYIIGGHELKANGKIHSRWCSNEKTAMEAALGMSYAGKRALVCMKHVGMNVCADAFVNSAITGVNGGLVVLAADDPSMHSSQNEQDSRFYAKFAMIPIFEPSNQQEAYNMMEDAFKLSESLKLPVLMRVVTRLAHSRANVEIKDKANEENQLNPDNGRHWVLLPAIARKNYLSLIEKQKDMINASLSRNHRRCRHGHRFCGDYDAFHRVPQCLYPGPLEKSAETVCVRTIGRCGAARPSAGVSGRVCRGVAVYARYVEFRSHDCLYDCYVRRRGLRTVGRGAAQCTAADAVAGWYCTDYGPFAADHRQTFSDPVF